MTTITKNKGQKMNLFISDVMVVEGNLYQVMGEDEMLYVYDAVVQAIVDGDIYHHKHVFKGHVQDPDGFDHPNYNAKGDAEALMVRVSDHGVINTDHWELVGNLSEMEDPLVRLEREWSDNSDHFVDYR
jgi:hypothetical protein